jgi:RNA polymerase sigma-70 factor (ECF subfamily)
MISNLVTKTSFNVENWSRQNLTREETWATLLRAAMSGDQKSYHLFLLDVTPYIRGMAKQSCARLGVPLIEAEDVVQEVLLTIHLKRSSWEPGLALEPWIWTIARNKIVEAVRRRSRLPTLQIAGSSH